MTKPNCIYGDASIDDTERTFFHYERWILERRNREAKVKEFCLKVFTLVLKIRMEFCKISYLALRM